MIYFSRFNLNEICTEGGGVRDIAFLNFFKDRNVLIKVIEKNKVLRFLKVPYFVLWFLRINNETIFIHSSSLAKIFPPKIFSLPFFKSILYYILTVSSIKNRIIIEVNDLPYEQSLDLELHLEKSIKKYMDMVLSIKTVEYVYASYKMMDYCRVKYKLNNNKTYFCLNGGDILPDIENQKKDAILRFVYAGTLNKGRQIEELISLFDSIERNDIELILCGINGEWIESLVTKDNIKYLGSLSDNEAKKVVSMCDIGIIPYDDERFYYNLCYPTKNSFYITSGIPFLSTCLEETMFWFEKNECAIFSSFDNWKSIVSHIEAKDIFKFKSNVSSIKYNFSWDNLISNLMKELKIKI